MAHPAPAVAPIPRRFTVTGYIGLVEAGILGEDDHVELLEGVVVGMPAQGVPHAAAMSRVYYALMDAVGRRGVIRVQLPLVQGDASMPEPDVAVLPGRLEDYDDVHPTTALLVVEVADSSLKIDRLTKAGIYAEHGIADYWIVDLVGDAVEVYRQPVTAERRYASVTVYRRGDAVTPLAFPEVSTPIDVLLPAPRR